MLPLSLRFPFLPPFASSTSIGIAHTCTFLCSQHIPKDYFIGVLSNREHDMYVKIGRINEKVFPWNQTQCLVSGAHMTERENSYMWKCWKERESIASPIWEERWDSKKH